MFKWFKRKPRPHELVANEEKTTDELRAELNSLLHRLGKIDTLTKRELLDETLNQVKGEDDAG